MVKRMHETGDVNIFDFLAQIRQQRNHLVQEEVGGVINTTNSPCYLFLLISGVGGGGGY